jgi:uncharacterized tellurite resistance protein B-like protein
MRKKKPSGIEFLFIVLYLFVLILTNFYLAILIIGGVAIFVWLISKSFITEKKPRVIRTSIPKHSYEITITRGPHYPDFKSTSSNGDEFWIPFGQSTKINGFDIGGLIYFGQGLESVGQSGPEPALIDKKLPMAPGEGNCHIRLLSYWPTYRGASPEARSAYIQWLSTGRMDPDADIGYVFLFFYGLERRVLHDAKVSKQAQTEIPIIQSEIERLLGIYKNSGSFQSYASSLVDLLKAQNTRERIFEKSPPPLIGGHWLSFEHKLGLAQCSAEGKPLPAEWAYTWIMGDPNARFRTPVYRCPEEFRGLFFHYYLKLYGDGMILPQNKTRLKLQHNVASPTFEYRNNDFKNEFDLPDVCVLASPLNKLKEIGEDCSSKLDGFSRAIGKDRINKDTFDSLIQLPLILWPDKNRQQLDQLFNDVHNADNSYIIPFDQFRSFFPGWQDVTRQNMLAVYQLLEETGLGMEPDIRNGGSIPIENAKIVLFKCGEQTRDSKSIKRYMAAALTLRLGASIIYADGVVSDIEKNLLRRQLDAWHYLNETERARLNAYLDLLLVEPPKLAGLKKHLDSLDSGARETLANFLTIVAQIDSTIDPKEIAALEKIFKVLGFDPRMVYSKMHVAAAEPVTIQLPSSEVGGYKIPKQPKDEPLSVIRLNADRIALLQIDSERVSAILGQIFVEETYKPETTDMAKDELSIEENKETSILGLNVEQSALIRLLLTRVNWARPELEEIALDRNILLDGALESINERSYSLFNKPLFEGDDPIILNSEVIREVLK